MRGRESVTALLFSSFILTAACQRSTAPAPDANSSKPSPLSRTTGTLGVDGFRDEVRIVRDRWGIPHIYAQNVEDLFMAQGLVQAQDRLFQIDLWRRSTQGRLAEVLGPNFIARDRMTRLVQYTKSDDEEWKSYAPDAREIAAAFVRGINAWIDITKDNLPEEFRVAGYTPEHWKAEDLLSRAEAFAMSSNATQEVFRSRLTTAVGLERATLLMPPDPRTSIHVPGGVDLAVVNSLLADGLANIGASARFDKRSATTDATRDRASQLAEARPGDEWPSKEGSNNWVIAGSRSATGKPILANDPHRNLDHPSLRYLVHLNAPGWNVIGSVVPWFPGVAIGHNERIAWGLTIFANDAQDLYVEQVNPANPRQYRSKGQWVDMRAVNDSINVKGRADAVAVEHLYTIHGPVVAVDSERHLAFALRWTGSEPGTAGYLGALSLDRANNWPEFREALKHWKMPGENFVYADVDGNIGYQAATMAPIRSKGLGLYPVPGWTGEYEWKGWYSLDDLPHAANPANGYLATSNHNTLPPGYKPIVGFAWSGPARISRVREVLEGGKTFSVDDFKKLQHDARPWNAEQLVPLLDKLHFADVDVERAREELVAWDKILARDSIPATIYVVWETKLIDALVAKWLEGTMASEYTRRIEPAWLVPTLTRPNATWFGPNPAAKRDAVLEAALSAAVAELKQTVGADPESWKWGKLHLALFRHALSPVDSAVEKRFNVGPIGRGGYGDAVFSTSGPGFSQTDGATFREVMDVADWDRSVGTSAPGQSGQPGSPHFDDLARMWGNEEYFPYSFSKEMVEKNAEGTLVLTPRR